MKRKLVATALFAMMATAGWAQFETGTKYIGASISGLSLGYSKAADVSFGLEATGGYYFSDCWLLKGNFGYGHKKSYDDLVLGAGVRYNFYQNGIFLGAGLEYQFQNFGKETVTEIVKVPEMNVDETTGKEYLTEKYEERVVTRKCRENNIRIPIEIGYTFYLNQHIAIEPSVYTKLSLNDFNDGTEFGLRIGLGYYF